MTLIAGIFERRSATSVDPAYCEELKSVISRRRDEAVTVLQNERVFFAKVDIGAYGHPAVGISPTGAVAMLAGDPLLSLDEPTMGRRRDKDLELLHESWNRNDWTFVRKAQGVFCAAHYVPSTGTLTLIADKLGLRPLYYWMDEERVVFASALRIIADLSFVRKTTDLRGLAELAAFGYPLGKRTPYSAVNLMQAAELLGISGASVHSRRYWRWDSYSSSRLAEEEQVDKLNQCFRAAIKKRLHDDAATVSFLSGGLDSRCVVSALRQQSAQVYTFNFGFPGAQDRIFSAAFAGIAQTVHFEGVMPLGEPRWSMMLSHAWGEVRGTVSYKPEHDQLCWSGDGGSVGLGHVYLSPSIVKHLHAGKVDTAIDTYLTDEKIGVPEKLFRRPIALALRDALHEGVQEELADIHCEDPGRAFHIFLMLNDQRRHLFSHFEDIDLHRMELQLPFFDGEFLSVVMGIPVSACLGHRLYTKWLRQFPRSVTSVPWQTYPGHDPCPVPAPEAAASQWSNSKAYRDYHRAGHRRLRRDVWRILLEGRLPHAILKREVLWAATALCWAGIGDYSYLLKAARTYSRFWIPGTEALNPPGHNQQEMGLC